MDLQAWDNAISIASNGVTAVGVIIGLLYGRRKVNELISAKLHEASFSSALSLYNEISDLRDKYAKIRLLLNFTLSTVNNLNRDNRPIDLETHLNLQRSGIEAFEVSMILSKCFTRVYNHNVTIKKDAMDIIQKALDAANQLTSEINIFFSYATKINDDKIPTLEDIESMRLHYENITKLQHSYIQASSESQRISFKNTFIFE
ncbi:hypothetical protein AB9X52_04720 [Enterobacter hormaechei]|uniref:hypothetical protein n=1 Tax=Enterobacter hormaechei TaxID=158836 RepID=UPI00321E4C43